MKYTTLGTSGIQVSRICLGSATFGVAPLAKDADAVVGRALDLGINFFDTSNSYGHQARFDRAGAPPAPTRASAEEIMGKALGRHRDEVIVATKVGEPVTPLPNGRGLSRVHMIAQVDESLRRLDTDHIDIYYADVADPLTPIEQTLHTFDELVHQGKIRYYALSRFGPSRLMEALWTAERLRLNIPVCFQLRYNLDDCAIEAEILPAAQRHGIDVAAFSPLGGGLLAGMSTASRPIVGSLRWGGSGFNEQQLALADDLDKLAADWGLPTAQISLAWLLAQPGVATAIIGAETVEEVEESVGSIDLELDAEQLALVDALHPQTARRA